jgi:hypothetical protein
MKIFIDIDKNVIIDYLKHNFIKIIKFLYGWFTNEGEILGYIFSIFHIMTSFTLLIMIVVCHTIYPAFWLQICVFVCLFVIWLHHVFLEVCIYISVEKELTKGISPYTQFLKSIFKNKVSTKDFIKYFMIIETIAVSCFGLEIVSRCFHYFFKYFVLQ